MQADEPRSIRFGIFDLDRDSGELRKHGIRIKLHEKPFQVLLALLHHPGQIVTRRELQEALWPADTFVDFENGLNNAISRLREALGDSAESPHYIETVPRRGYRFVGTVEAALPASPAVAPGSGSQVTVNSASPSRWVLISAGMVAMLAAVFFLYRTFQTSPPAINSIAVLPFVTASDGDAPRDAYLAFGMTEALIAELSKIRALKVISQTSVLQYQGARKPLPQIARELGVRAVVEGSVVRQGDQLRITVQLIDASTDTHLWAQTYQRQIADVLVMQSEVAQAIAREVRVQVTPREKVALSTASVVDPQAQEAYLKGRYFLRKAGEESWKKAEGYFEEAITTNPQYAAAYAGLAEYYVQTDLMKPELAMAKAKERAQRAIALDPELADARVSLGLVHYYGDWDWDGADREFRRALDLEPGNARAHRWYSIYLETVGRHNEAIEHLQLAIASDPLSIGVYDTGANVWFQAHEFDRAIEQGRKILELDQNDPRGYEQITVSLIQKGDYQQAVTLGRKGLQLTGDPGDPVFSTLLSVAYGRLGQPRQSAEHLNNLQEAARKNGYVPLGFLAIIHAGLGRKDAAMDSLEKAYQTRDPYMVRLKVSPWFDDLQSHPRFQALLRKMNFPPQGSAPDRAGTSGN